MKMNLILASVCSLLISCATLKDMIGSGEPTPEQNGIVSLDGGGTSSPDVGVAPAANADQTYAAHEMSDSQAPAEAQAAEQQTAQVDTMNEQRSSSELDAAAPEAGSDSFHASTTQTPGIDSPVEEVPPQVLPEKTGASWDKQASATEPSYEEPKYEKPSYKKSSKKSSKIAKKQSKKHIAKKEKKSKREIAKASKKSKKSIAKSMKPKDCKKIAKSSKKATQKAVAMCKIENKKIAQKNKKLGKVASAGRGSSIR